MYIQYEAHKVYFAYVKYDVISYMTSPCRAEEDRLDLLKNILAQGYTRHKLPIYFHIYIQQVSLFQNM